jgi:hypothetical protein
LIYNSEGREFSGKGRECGEYFREGREFQGVFQGEGREFQRAFRELPFSLLMFAFPLLLPLPELSIFSLIPL